jgi:hypothetical protein
LKWSNENSVDTFKKIINEDNSFNNLLEWLKNTSSQISDKYRNILFYCTLTGLRPTGAINSINLIKSNLDNYLDKEEMILKHIKYPSIFIRNTKKACISIVNESIIQIAKDTKEKSSYDSLHSYSKRRNIPFNFNYL